jgi:hypothetical protein
MAHIPCALLERGAAWGTSSIEAATLPPIEGDCALVVIHFPSRAGFHSKRLGRHYATRRKLFPTTPFGANFGMTY